MPVLFKRVCAHLGLGTFAKNLVVYVCVVEEGMCTCKIGMLWNQLPVLMLMLLNLVYTPLRLGMLENILYSYVCVVV